LTVGVGYLRRVRTLPDKSAPKRVTRNFSTSSFWRTKARRLQERFVGQRFEEGDEIGALARAKVDRNDQLALVRIEPSIASERPARNIASARRVNVDDFLER